MTTNEVRQKFLEFFAKRGHTIVPSAPLVPKDDPSVLFTTAGMQQFKPYYTGEKDAVKDFGSKNIASVQKCIRTSDIDEIGDATHLTFFEMLGNFSFGGYGRKEAIAYAHEFMTKELGLPISYVSFFKGSETVPRDSESEEIWKVLGVAEVREEGADVFWGPTGSSGPCGPTTEIYCKDANGKDVEIWNIVFNEYFCNGSREQLDKGDATLTKLPFLGIDTGMGLERLCAILQKKESVYETDLFAVSSHLLSRGLEEKTRRIIMDHARAIIFSISDGVHPANKGAGYVLRRLMRRVITFQYLENIGKPPQELFKYVINQFKVIPDYNNLNEALVSRVFEDEYGRFMETLASGLTEFFKKYPEMKVVSAIRGEPYKYHQLKRILGEDAFYFHQTYGLTVDVLKDLAAKGGHTVDEVGFNLAFSKHKEISRAGAEKKFKGGLADTSEASVKYHTATHLLHQALREVLGKEVQQKGSNITPERLRFDFAFPRKMTDEEKKKVEDIVNEKIQADLPVQKVVLPLAEAKKTGALHFFGEKYGEQVSVYYIGGSLDTAYSKEFCGGPHVKNTSELYFSSRAQSRDCGPFKIVKEEAVSAGVRRIKAIL